MAARLGDEEGVAVRQHDDVGHQQHPFGAAGHEGEGGERIERIVPAGLQPLVGRGRVVGEPDAVEPRGLGGLGEADQPVGSSGRRRAGGSRSDR